MRLEWQTRIVLCGAFVDDVLTAYEAARPQNAGNKKALDFQGF